jgi:CHAD domain-containing protein
MSVYQENIHKLFVKTYRQLTKAATNAQAGNIHRMRTSMRRLEAVLEELSPELDRNQRKLLKVLARLRRRAGKVRDIDVHVAALRTLKLSDEPGRKTQILSKFADLRIARERKLSKVFDEMPMREIRKRLRRAEANFQLGDRFPGAFQLAYASFIRLTHDHEDLQESDLHAYRIRGKRARYVAELASNETEAKAFVDALKNMQDVLGDWHDWLTLSQAVAKLSNSSSNSPLLSALNNIARAKFHEAVRVVAETKRIILASAPPTMKPRASLAPRQKMIPARSLVTAAA